MSWACPQRTGCAGGPLGGVAADFHLVTVRFLGALPEIGLSPVAHPQEVVLTWRFLRAVVAGLLLAACAVIAPAPASAAAPARIMALGDSITGSPGCWRALLWKHLQDTGHTDV